MTTETPLSRLTERLAKRDRVSDGVVLVMADDLRLALDALEKARAYNDDIADANAFALDEALKILTEGDGR